MISMESEIMEERENIINDIIANIHLINIPEIIISFGVLNTEYPRLAEILLEKKSKLDLDFSGISTDKVHAAEKVIVTAIEKSIDDTYKGDCPKYGWK